MEARTKQAPLTKLGWSATYIGAVSYKKLVLIIATSASFWLISSLTARNLLGDSSSRSACSIFANLSPRFEPKAMATLWK